MNSTKMVYMSIKKIVVNVLHLPKEEEDRANRLAEELRDTSPFDINAEEIEPLWFVHPKDEIVFCKIIPTPNLKDIVTVWLTMTTTHDKAILLTMRKATEREKSHYRSKKSDA